ncbi:MAG: amidohydrolase family protein, partial [Acidobacteriota bacterium]
MRSVHTLTPRWILVVSLTAAAAWVALVATSVSGQTPGAVAVYEGARLIDGRGGPPIDNAVFVVEGTRVTQVGRVGQIKPPANATRVALAGKTVIPAIIDTHVHVPATRDALLDMLYGKAYYGVGTVLSLGTDGGDLAFQVRSERVPGAAGLLTAGRGITMPEPGRSDVPYWIASEAEGRKAVQELAARKVDFVKIWVDDRDGKYKKLTPPLYGAIIDEAHKHGLRVAAHIFALEDAKGLLKAGIDAFAHSVRDRDIDDEFVAMMKARPQVVLVPNLPDRGVKTDLGWLSETIAAGELK